MNELKTRINRLDTTGRARLHEMLDNMARSAAAAPRRQPLASAPLSLPQQRLWLLAELGNDEGAYNIPGLFRIRGGPGHDTLAQALAQAVRRMGERHEILRTTFDADPDGQARQCIQAQPMVQLQIEATPLPASEAAQGAWAQAIVRQGIDLRRGPCWRAVLAPCEDGSAMLCLSFHHIVFDGWSLGLFVGELFELALSSPDRVRPAPALQYSDYVTWQARRFDAAAREREVAHWQQTLAAPLPVLDLPTDQARENHSHAAAEGAAAAGALHQHALSPALHQAAKDGARQLGVTPYAVYLATLAALLARHGGCDEVVIGTPVSGRDSGSLGTMLGVFVNTLPIRIHLGRAANFAELAQQVRDRSLAAFEHATLPFDAMVQALQAERPQGRHPVFQVLYTHQNAVAPVRAPGLEVIYEDLDQGSAKFELSLDVVEGPKGPNCLWEYRTGLFGAERIERLAGQFERLLTAALAAPQASLASLPLLSDDELAQVCTPAAAAAAAALPAVHLVELIERHAASQPDAVAVRDQGRSLSWQALNRGANQLAQALRARGVLADGTRPVALALPRGAALVQAVLAVLKAGCPFVALDTSHPAARLAAMLDDVQAQALVHDASTLTLADDMAAAIEQPWPAGRLALDDDGLPADAVATAADDPALPIAASDTAYIVFTSGTTGRPKGVRVTHRNAVNAYLGWREVYRLEAPDGPRRHLQMAASGFDVFCGDLIRALGSGATLVVCPGATLAEPDRLAALIEAEAVDFAEFVPAVFRGLAQHLWDSGASLPGLQTLVVASDSWYMGEYRRYRQLLAPGARLVNSYGMAEATIDSTWFADEGDTGTLTDGAPVPVGRPFPNVQLLVLDPQGQPCPPGVPGEICIGGAGVAGGYVHRPALNKERFIAHPLGGDDEGRGGGTIYRTGDIGWIDGQGRLRLQGRRDAQVKLNGVRIELGEVELALQAAGLGLRAAAAVVRGDAVTQQARLLAFVVAEPGMPTPAEGLEAAAKAALARLLPAAMVPSRIVLLEALPLSANGKVDRARLPALDDEQSATASGGRGFVAPRTLSEDMLATIFAQVFKLPRVGAHDHFFELGGHSLLALQVVQRAREAFAVDLPLRTLFEHPTVAALAAVIAELQGRREAHDETVNAVPQIVPDTTGLDQPFPLTEVQQAYWLGRNAVFEFGNVTTHSYDEMETGELDAARFERAWNRVVRRHPMLRAVILEDGTQRILSDPPTYHVPVLDLSQQPEAEAETALLALRNEMSHQMLDVHRFPVFDVRLTRLPQGRTRIHFSSDALMFDVWSFVIIIEDLARAYLDETLELPPLALSFRDYVLAEAALRETPRYAQALAYWRQRVQRLPAAPELPMAQDPSALEHPRFTRLHATLDPARWARLKLKAVRAGMTTTGLMLAAYAEVLAVYSRDPAFSLNLTFLNRHPLHPQVNDIVGEFTSLTLLSCDLSLDKRFIDRARRVQGDLWSDLEHHAISGVQVLRDLTRSRGGATRAKMPVVFTSALVVPIPQRRPELPINPVYRDGVTQTSQVWLDCGVWEDQGMLLCNWDVVLELYPEGLIQEMFAAYWALVGRLADTDEAWQAELLSVTPPAPAVETMAPADADELPPLAVGDETLYTLFLRSLARQPQATALIDGDRRCSYADVAGHMAWVARALQGRVARGELVAVFMDKGWAQVPAVLGVVATAAAYLPLDPGLPDERVRELLADAGVRHVMTTSAHASRAAALLGDAQAVLVLERHCQLPIDGLYALDGPVASDLAYTIFTSGSTGRPKGVMIDHRGAVNTLLDLIQRWQLQDRLTVLAVSALNFDLSVFDIFGALAAGGTVVIPSHERRLDPTHWLSLVQRHRVTVWNSVPALAALLVDHAREAGTRLPSLQRVMLSGDWIPVNLPDRVRAVAPAAAITSLGGATEASIWSVLYEIDRVSPMWRSIPYGRAMRNQRIEVLNDRLEPCPTWVVGQIHIAGTGLALGYFGDSTRTETAFVRHPGRGERWYRTGDLGRRLPDGNIEFLGRNDNQVKVQGMRIELGEIEAALARHPQVQQAVAAALGEHQAEKRLVGWYVPAADTPELAPEDLREWLRSQLPEYMVPLLLLPLQEVALTRNGKVDRAALPVPAILSGSDTEASSEPVPPRDAHEAAIAAIWCEVLKLPAVGVHDDFFAVGGDSMLAIRVLTLLRHRLALEVQLKQVFRHPTVAALAEVTRLPGASPRI